MSCPCPAHMDCRNPLTGIFPDCSCPQKTEEDPINPSHYKQGGIECIDAIEAALTPEEFRGFLKGTTFKYLWRCNHKGRTIEDLKKAQWYLDRLVQSLEAKE